MPNDLEQPNVHRTGPIRPDLIVAALGVLAAGVTLVAALIGTGLVDPAVLPWWPWKPRPGILYAADWSRDVDGWSVPEGWSTYEGALMNSAPASFTPNCPSNWIAAPWDAGETADYALEVSLSRSQPLDMLLEPPDPQSFVALVVRSGYYLYVGMVDSGDGLGPQSAMQLLVRDVAGLHVMQTYTPAPFDGEIHDIRVVVAGDQIEVWLDNNPVIRAIDGTHRSGGKVGLWCWNSLMSVDAFQVVSI